MLLPSLSRRRRIRRYLAGDSDPARHGEPGTFEVALLVEVESPDQLEAQRDLEQIAGELLAHARVSSARVVSVARVAALQPPDVTA